MSPLPVSYKSGDSLARVVVLVLMLGLTSSDLTASISPYVSWIAYALAMILLLPYGLREMLLPRRAPNEPAARVIRSGLPARIPAVLFLFAVCMPVVYGTAPTPALVALGKLATILLVGLPVLAARLRLAMSAFYGLLGAVLVNFSILLIGILAAGPTAGMMGPSRWGTALNYPGALWRLAITAWMYASYLTIRRFSVRYLSLFLVSTLLVFMDGARTALLLLVFGAIALLAILGMEAGHFRKVLMTGLVGAVVLGASFATLGINFSPQEGALGRISTTVMSVADLGTDGLGVADNTRFAMLQTGLAAIQEHPVLGTGIGSTTIKTAAGSMVIHMTYLQVWADMGILGFIAYLWLVWGWLPWLPMALSRIRSFPDDRKRAVYYNAIYLLFVFGLTGLFHPLSTEWAQWLPFIVPYALLWHLMRSTPNHKGQLCVASPSL